MTNGPGRIELGRILAGESHAPVVYFARMADKVKIGTTTNLKQRMRSFYLELSDVLVVVPGGKDVEAAYHKRFGSSRLMRTAGRNYSTSTTGSRSFWACGGTAPAPLNGRASPCTSCRAGKWATTFS